MGKEQLDGKPLAIVLSNNNTQGIEDKLDATTFLFKNLGQIGKAVKIGTLTQEQGKTAEELNKLTGGKPVVVILSKGVGETCK